eukprot:gb/GECG01009795.1/.p1 GENE.gb/GECG01009795.1/~~gb/GECG01009795.1/.p1  ORF type:complete len:761 (+),score=103.42 gb/GECG01009795.1/:1-2283(+)
MERVTEERKRPKTSEEAGSLWRNRSRKTWSEILREPTTTKASTPRSRSPPPRGPQLRTSARSASRLKKSAEDEERKKEDGIKANTYHRSRTGKSSFTQQPSPSPKDGKRASSPHSTVSTSTSARHIQEPELERSSFNYPSRSQGQRDSPVGSVESKGESALPPAGTFSYNPRSGIYKQYRQRQQDTLWHTPTESDHQHRETLALVRSLTHELSESKQHIEHWGHLLRQKLQKLVLARGREERLKSQIDLERRRARQLTQTLRRTLEHAEAQRGKSGDDHESSLFERAFQRASNTLNKPKYSDKAFESLKERESSIERRIKEVQTNLEQVASAEKEMNTLPKTPANTEKAPAETVDKKVVQYLSSPEALAQEHSAVFGDEERSSARPPPLDIPTGSTNAIEEDEYGESSSAQGNSPSNNFQTTDAQVTISDEQNATSFQYNDGERAMPGKGADRQQHPVTSTEGNLEALPSSEESTNYSTTPVAVSPTMAVKSPTKKRGIGSGNPTRYSLYQHTASSLRRTNEGESLRRERQKGTRSARSSSPRGRRPRRMSPASSATSRSGTRSRSSRSRSPSESVRSDRLSKQTGSLWDQLSEMKVADVLRSPRAADLLLRTLTLLQNKQGSSEVSESPPSELVRKAVKTSREQSDERSWENDESVVEAPAASRVKGGSSSQGFVPTVAGHRYFPANQRTNGHVDNASHGDYGKVSETTRDVSVDRRRVHASAKNNANHNYGRRRIERTESGPVKGVDDILNSIQSILQ